MPYDQLTLARFRVLKPQFAEVSDELVQVHLDMASRFVDDSWTEGDYETAWAAMASHLLTLEGFGASAEAEIIRNAGGRVSSLKSGTLSLTFNAPDGQEVGSVEWMKSTSAGSMYYMLLKLNRGGPRLLTGHNLSGFLPPMVEVPSRDDNDLPPLSSVEW